MLRRHFGGVAFYKLWPCMIYLRLSLSTPPHLHAPAVQKRGMVTSLKAGRFVPESWRRGRETGARFRSDVSSTGTVQEDSRKDGRRLPRPTRPQDRTVRQAGNSDTVATAESLERMCAHCGVTWRCEKDRDVFGSPRRCAWPAGGCLNTVTRV